MKPTAAGGKRMATCGGDKSLVERDRKGLTRISRTSDPRTMVGNMRGVCGEYAGNIREVYGNRVVEESKVSTRLRQGVANNDRAT